MLARTAAISTLAAVVAQRCDMPGREVLMEVGMYILRHDHGQIVPMSWNPGILDRHWTDYIAIEWVCFRRCFVADQHKGNVNHRTIVAEIFRSTEQCD